MYWNVGLIIGISALPLLKKHIGSKSDAGKEDFLESLKNAAEIRLSPTFYYGSAADLVLQKGHEPQINKGLSEEQIEYITSVIEDSLIAQEGAKVGMCYHNVFALILADYQDRMEFVEGYACTSNGIVFRHAWVELDGGYIVDITWSNTEQKMEERISSEDAQTSVDISDRVLGEIPNGYHYLGVIIPKDDVTDFYYSNRLTSLLLESHRNNFKYLKEEFEL